MNYQTGFNALFFAVFSLACAASTAQQGTNENPFKKNTPQAATRTKPAARPAVLKPLAAPVAAPAEGGRLTAVSQGAELPPRLVLPPIPPSVPGGALIGAQTPASGAESGKTPEKSSPFIARELIEAKRALCNTSLVGPTVRQLAFNEAELTLKFKKLAGQSCLSAVSIEGTWVDAQLDTTNDEVRLIVDENTSAVARSTWVTVVAGAQSFRLKVNQEATSAAPGPSK